MGMIAKGVGGLLSTYAEETSNEANMVNAMINRDIDMFKATDAMQRGQSAGSVKQMQGTAHVGSITQRAAAGGVDVSGSGSVAKAMTDTKATTAYDVNMIRANAERQSFGELMKARDETIKIETAKRDSMLIPFKNLVGAFGGGEFNIGGGSGESSTGYAGVGKGGGDYGDYGDLGMGYGAGD